MKIPSDLKPSKTYKVGFKVVKLEPDNFHIIVKGKLGNQVVHLVIDTGASHTCFDINFIKSYHPDINMESNDGLNVGVGSSDFTSNISVIPELSIGRLKITDYLVVLLDLQHINTAYATMKLPLIEGILGSDFFVKHRVNIDYENHCLIIKK